MPKVINVKGTVVSDDDAWIYNWFGIEAVSPNVISAALAEANGDDVVIRINSHVGDIFAGSEIYALISS